MKSKKLAKKLANLLPGGKIGHKGGTGRPPDWLKEKCQKIVDSKKLVEWLGRVANGESEDSRVFFDDDGNVHREKVAASIKDRVHAAEILLDRGFGKAPQSLEVEVSESPEQRAATEKRFERLYGYMEKATK